MTRVGNLLLYKKLNEQKQRGTYWVLEAVSRE